MSVPTSSKNAILCQAIAQLGKESGVLTLTKRKLTWSPNKNGVSNPSIAISCSTIMKLLASKASAAEPKLKVVTANDESHVFAVPSGDDAEKFKFHLGEITSRNKARAEEANKGEGPSSNVQQVVDPGSGSSYARTTNHQKKRLNKNELKAAVLKRSPDLARLHADLVRSGHITEAEFWEGREHLILAEAAADAQRRGKSSLIVDPRPVRDETGKATTKLSPEMIEEIFEEFPVVRRAYDENVPKRLSDQQFWNRYLQSKLASRNSASARGAASEHTVKDDPIFDKYLEKEDDAPEPRNQRDAEVERLVDLHATAEDHPDTGNTMDVTMQAGKQKQALPLIRRFNEHSERLLNSALGSEPASKKRRLFHENDDEYIDSIMIDDLQAPQTSVGIPLEMKDSQRYFEGGKAGDAMVIDSSGVVDINTTLPIMVAGLDTWAEDMSRIRLEKKAGDEALQKMTSNIRARVEGRLKRNEIPDDIMNEMTSLQTATSEFLRQFWSAVHPPPPDQGVLSVATPEQLTARKDKMAGYLKKTRDKIQAIADQAGRVGVEESKVHAAFQQTVISVDAAIQAYNSS